MDRLNNGGGDRFWKSSFLKLWVSHDLDPDLGWPWNWYHREWLIDPNKYHYLVCGSIEYDCGRTYGRTYIRTDLRMDILPGLLGHLWWDDLIKIKDENEIKINGILVLAKVHDAEFVT